MLINPLYWPTLDIVSLQDDAFESIYVSLSQFMITFVDFDFVDLLMSLSLCV